MTAATLGAALIPATAIAMSGRGPVVRVVETTAGPAERLAARPALRFATRPVKAPFVIRIDDARRFQRVTGVGAAMTDSAAWLMHQRLGRIARSRLMRALYGRDGLHLGFTLIPIGGSDFTVGGRPYTYDDLAPGQSDPRLRHFSVAHDDRYIVPMLRQMLAVNPRVQTLAVPWTAPPWMKANHAYGDTGYGGSLLRSAWRPFAGYFVRFIEAYRRRGIPIDGIAPENEPRSPAPYPAMHFTAADEASWLVRDLAPALAAAHLRPRIYGGDASFNAAGYAVALLRSPARRVLDGVAAHCYHGPPAVLAGLHAIDPALDLVESECANQNTPYPVPEILIGGLRHWASTVALWNLALDPSGGPVERPNVGCVTCRGLVTVNPRNGTVAYSRDYFQVGQVSRYLAPGARRVASTAFVRYFHRSPSSYGYSRGLDDVAFVNPDGERVLVAYANSRSALRFAVSWEGRYFSYKLLGGAMVTFRWRPVG